MMTSKSFISQAARLFAAAVIIAGSVWFYFKAEKRIKADKSAPAVAVPEEKRTSGTAVTPKKDAVIPKKGLWRFEGEVLDLIRGKPVEGVNLTFFSPEHNKAFSGQTDKFGKYSLQLDPLPEGEGYEVSIKHPDYNSNSWWDGSKTALPKEERYRIMNVMQFRASKEWSRHKGGEGTVSIYAFAIAPLNLTKEERDEQYRATTAETTNE